MSDAILESTMHLENDLGILEEIQIIYDNVPKIIETDSHVPSSLYLINGSAR
jgi:hypothetical protein